MNKKNYLSIFITLVAAGVILIVFGSIAMLLPIQDWVGSILLFLGSLAILTAVGYWLKFLYMMWKIFRNNAKDITPGKAVGYLFIPVFNLFWIFIAVHRMTLMINHVIVNRGSAEKPVSKGLSLALCVLFILPWFPLFTAAYKVDIYFISALLMVMGVMLKEWSRVAVMISGNMPTAEEVKLLTGTAGARTEIAKTVLFAALNIFGYVIISAVLVTFLGMSFLVPFAGYKESAYIRVLRTDLNNAHSAAQAYFTGNPLV